MNARAITMAGSAFLAAICAIALLSARGLDMGSLSDIGPGLFPITLASILLGLAAVLAMAGIFQIPSQDMTAQWAWSLRGLVFILGAVVFFGVSIRPLGLAVAAPVTIMIAGMADRETRWLQLAIFAVSLSAFCVTLFRLLLGLPIPLAPWLIGY